MTAVLIVGGGGIGSRHAQGVASTGRLVDRVIVVDPDPAARATTEQRYREVAGADAPDLVLASSLDEVEGAVRVAIVATTARIRAEVTEAVVEACAPADLILEKVLFQRPAEYPSVVDLVSRAGVSAWVNLPRRYSPGWSALIDRAKGTEALELAVSGSGWGLACNAVHFLDMVRELDPDGALEVSTEGLRPGVVPSKREGYVEVLGTLRARCGRVTAALRCDDLVPGPMSVVLRGPHGRWSLDDRPDELVMTAELDGRRALETFPPTPPQSRLTGSVVAELLAGAGCRLPTLEHAAATHLPFLDALLEHFPAEFVVEGRCPIT